MNILSLKFWFFILITTCLYFLTPKKYRWAVLLFASYYFYAQSGYKNFLYIITTTLTIYFAASKIEKINIQRNKYSRRSEPIEYNKYQLKSKKILIGTLVLNFGILFFLKYYKFPEQILRTIYPGSTILKDWASMSIIMPLGISFYTFQATGYLIDVYRGKIEASSNLGKFALFVSYFPQIIQGPISKFEQLYGEFENPKDYCFNRMNSGLQLIMWGFFKKLVIADRAAVIVNQVYGNYSEYTGIIIFMGALFYSIQIYGDFSGGIDIIRGISEILGIEMVDNFNRPYFSRSIGEFWKRWHITLGDWMRDYVFYPIALSKSMGKISRKARKKLGNHIGKQIAPAIASSIVFIIVGAWHGSSLKFIAYGVYNGIFVLSEPMLAPVYKKMRNFFGISNEESFSFIGFQVLRTIFITTLGRIFSRATSFRSSIGMFVKMFSVWNPWVLFDQSLYSLGLDKQEMTVLVFSLLILLVIGLVQEKGIKFRELFSEQPLIFRWFMLIVFILFILVYGYYGPNVSAADFIYGGF